MIRVSRGPEPAELRRERRQRLARAILRRRARQEVEFEGYEVAKAALVEKLNEKCVFCEKDLRPEGSLVEHFRPKAYVENEGEPRDASRYWWLAWTWENLLFACFRCNTICKRNQFPLQPGTRPLAELSLDLDTEQSLLLDPARVDPREHIRFRWSEKRQRWLPVPIRGSLMGARTIELLRLDQDERPSRHVKNRVDMAIRALRREMSRGDEDAVRVLWNDMMESLFERTEQFHAVTWDALDAAFPAVERQHWGVELPRLGAEPDAHPAAPLFVDPPESAPLLAALPEELALRVRALGAGAPRGEVLALVGDLQALRAWTDDELAYLLDRQPSTIGQYRRASQAGASDTATGQQPPDSDGES